MPIESTEPHSAQVSVKGVIQQIPAVDIDGLTIIATGSWFKVASIHSEPWWPGEVENAASIIEKLREQPLKADIFTFSQKLPHTQAKFNYPMVWDNVAAIPITTYDQWWEKRLSQDTRRNVRLAAKRGLVVQTVPFSDELVHGISEIYNETPFRNGRRFWHYGKELQKIKIENSTYLDRSHFIAAHCGSELVGFCKMVDVNNVACIMQFLSKDKHQDKRPMNAMIAKAVEVCCAKGMSHLMYRKYVYGKNEESSLTEFKRRNGFEQILLPTYFVPLTAKGKTVMLLNLHLGIKEVLPKQITSPLLKLRKMYYERFGNRQKPANNRPIEL